MGIHACGHLDCTYGCSGVWPPGPQKSVVDGCLCVKPGSTYSDVIDNIGGAHRLAYDAIKATGSQAAVGVAHYIGEHMADSAQWTGMPTGTLTVYTFVWTSVWTSVQKWNCVWSTYV